jgi:hypothetical protein
MDRFDDDMMMMMIITSFKGIRGTLLKIRKRFPKNQQHTTNILFTLYDHAKKKLFNTTQ